MNSVLTVPLNETLDNRKGDRRYFQRRGHSAAEIEIAATCLRAGGVFVGLQFGVPSLGVKTLVLFNNDHGSTLGIEADQFSEENVRVKLIESNARWYGEAA